mmetsp:Transcript_27048/g.64622  ORF Transcript_27048/g.64622 Transcript_27048/m.64622 type:complete len:710 (-) Transcript_27048:262-2391(-)
MPTQKTKNKKIEEGRRDGDVCSHSSSTSGSSSSKGSSILLEDTTSETTQQNVRQPMPSTNKKQIEGRGGEKEKASPPFTNLSYGTVATAELTTTDIDSDYSSTNAYYDLDDGSGNEEKQEQEQERHMMSNFAFYSTDRRHTIEKRSSSSSSSYLPLSWLVQRSASEHRKPIAIRPSEASRKRTRDVRKIHTSKSQHAESQPRTTSSSLIRMVPFSFFVNIISNNDDNSHGDNDNNDILKSDRSTSTAATETSRLIDRHKGEEYHERDRSYSGVDDCDEGGTSWFVEQQSGDETVWSSIHTQSWKVTTTFVSTILVVVVACYLSGFRNGSIRNDNSTNNSSGNTREYYGIKSGIPGSDLLPEWEWDRNVYLPPPVVPATATASQQQHQEEISNTGGDDSTVTNSSNNMNNQRRLALIAAITPDKSLRRLTEMSSRVNRAYARQWQMDYTEYSAGFRFHNDKSCFDKSYVLKTIVEEMTTRSKTVKAHDHDGASSLSVLDSSLSSSSLEEEEEKESPPKVPYDAIVLLPSDAIILDLDQNIVDTLLPPQKLAAISGWNQIDDDDDDNKLSSNAGVVMINLRHELAKPVAELWWKMSQRRSVSCGDDTGLNLLLDAVAEVFSESTYDISTPKQKQQQQYQQQQDGQWTDLIATIHERSNGVLGDQSMKVIPGLVPGDRTDFLSHNIAECSETLQQTTASVCYRFYPRCEVVP